MRFLLSFAGWATLTFLAAWLIHPSWEHGLAAIGGRLAAPPGAEIEILDLELFYPFDLGVFVALCLASSWAPRGRRGRAIVVGTPALVLVEVLSLVVALKALMVEGTDPSGTGRFASEVIHVSGLVAASAAWLYLLGRDRLSLVSGRWLG